MSHTETSHSALATLTDKEREILALLTAGHTVKSIAARLGRSEASINERLRDARRKTGVGSSRELARLLDAQKNRDRNIDLSKHGSPACDPVPLRTAGRTRSKGLIIMLIAIPIAATIGLIMAEGESKHQAAQLPATYAATPKQQPLAGNWSLDVMRIPEEERPRRVTMAFRISQNQQWSITVDITNPDGSTRHAEGTAAADGVAVPISGNIESINTASLRQPAPNTLVVTFGKNGTPVSTRVYTVSRDRKSMTETIIWAGNSIPKLETTYFNRID